MIRKIVLCLMFLTIINFFVVKNVFGATIPPQRPNNFRANYPVYDENTKENIITLNWDASINADFYLLEVNADTNWANQTMSQVIKVEVGTTYNDIRKNLVSNPSSGTVYSYKLYAATNERDEFGEKLDEYVTSVSFAELSVLTNPVIIATALSTSEIKIIWDDIKFGGNSIDYEIQKYINGIRVGQDQIRASDLGSTVIRANGKIEYTLTNLDKSTEYEIRIVPQLDPDEIKFNPYFMVSTATNIRAYLQKYNDTIIKFIWDEYQGSIPSSDLYYKVIEVLDEDSTKVYKIIATPEVPYYYIQLKNDKEYSYMIEVLTKDGDEKVAESAEVSLADIAIPTTPAIPQLSNNTFDNRIELLWGVPTNINGVADDQMKYDVWMFTDPDFIDSVRKYYIPENENVYDNRVGKDLFIQNGISTDTNYSIVQITGTSYYKYQLNNLLPNTTYYVAVVAKKDYLIQDAENPEVLLVLSYNSEPSMMSIKTSTGSIDQPIALVNPNGVSINVDSQGGALVTSSSISIKWPMGDDSTGTFKSYYDNDVYFKVGYEIYTDSFDKTLTNDPNNTDYNVHTTNVTLTRGIEETSAIITGLNTNTLYVFWVKAYRDVQEQEIITKVSEASDAVIIATLPNYDIPDIVPPVPALSVIDEEYSDKVTLQFNSLSNISYEIIWNTSDNVSTSTGKQNYTALSNTNPDSVIINDLEPGTMYYFFIRANNNEYYSEWSDSIVGITRPILPPDAPRGFGIKNVIVNGKLSPDIGEKYITVQWDKISNLSYVIEISKSDDFLGSELTEISNVSEYEIEKFNSKELTSNTRYWIRIVAKDEDTNMTSLSSPYLTVKTKMNYDEYTSSEDTEVNLDEIKVKEEINGKNGTWNFDLSGTVSDKVMEEIDNKYDLDYKIDLSQTSVSGINKRYVIIPNKVLKMLSDKKQNLIIITDKSKLIFLPDSLNFDLQELDLEFGQDIDIKIALTTVNVLEFNKIINVKSLSDISELEITILTSEKRQVVQLEKQIKILMQFEDDSQAGTVFPYYLYPGKSNWTRVDGFKQISDSQVEFYFDKAGRYIINKEIITNSDLGDSIYRNEIAELLTTGIMKSVDSKILKPSEYIRLEDAIKMVLDSAGEEYENDYLEVAKKAGILDNINLSDLKRTITKEEAIDMIMKLFQIKTGQELGEIAIESTYADMNNVNEKYRANVINALKLKILIPNGSYIEPKSDITRGEMLVLIKRLVDLLNIY